MVLSLPIFGLKQTSIPSPRSSMTNLTAAAGHHRRSRASSAVSVGRSAKSTTTHTQTHAHSHSHTHMAEKDVATDENRNPAASRGGSSKSIHEDEQQQQQDGQQSADTAATKPPAAGHTSESKSHSAASTTLRETLNAVPPKESEEDAERRELNDSLARLAELFPDIKVEVFRELLTRFDGTSRLQVCIEQLLRYRTEWVRGRWNVPGHDNDANDNLQDGIARANAAIANQAPPAFASDGVPLDEQFRTEEYKKAVRTLVGSEFKALSRSTIDAVLAEVNFSYTRARPTLRELSSKTWRATIGNLFTIRRRQSRGRDWDCEDHPLISWKRLPGKSGGVMTQPVLKETDNAELNAELHGLFLAPMLARLREEQEFKDLTLAEQLNETEAREVGALYECDCCFSDVTFEQISTCSSHGHVICFNCIQRTTQEALFGQGWDKSVDVARGTLRCLAPSPDGCQGFLNGSVVRRALLASKGGKETCHKFEARLASHSLMNSQLQLIYCPFCSYAEIDPIYHPPPQGISWTFRRYNLAAFLLAFTILLDFFQTLVIPLLLVLLFYPSSLRSVFSSSFRNLCLKHRSQRFKCAHPGCGKVSCITCHKEWRDPHVCHEPLLMSLRTTVEAARTAAVKRTCPRCGLSFVKSSGCNKLTCICGYSMCYLCRKALNPPSASRRGNNRRQLQNGEILDAAQAAGDEPDEFDDAHPNGYKHFCEHFRAVPGSRCTECNKCDLYRTEDDEDVARRAGEEAERMWRIREGLIKPAAQAYSGGSSEESNEDDEDGEASNSQWTSPELNPHAHPTVATPGWNNMENLRIRLDEALAAGKGPDLFRTYGPGADKDWWHARLKFWLYDVWRFGRWRDEGQRLIDSLVELTVHVEV